jgi:hypothetical protein
MPKAPKPLPSGGKPSPNAAEADILGDAATMTPPTGAPSGDKENDAAEEGMPDSSPSEDENRPGFIGERNRPQS